MFIYIMKKLYERDEKRRREEIVNGKLNLVDDISVFIFWADDEYTVKFGCCCIFSSHHHHYMLSDN